MVIDLELGPGPPPRDIVTSLCPPGVEWDHRNPVKRPSPKASQHRAPKVGGTAPLPEMDSDHFQLHLNHFKPPAFITHHFAIDSGHVKLKTGPLLDQ